MSQKKMGPCGCIVGLFAFGFFSIIWDVAAEAWGLSHTKVLLIFFGIAVAVTTLGQRVMEDGWSNLLGWMARRRRARRSKDL